MESTVDEYDTLQVHPLFSSDKSSSENDEVHILHISLYLTPQINLQNYDGEDDDTEESDSDHDSSFTHPTALKQLQ